MHQLEYNVTSSMIINIPQKLRSSEMNALQKCVEVQLQELKGQIASMERQLGIEARLQELKREIEELKVKRKET